MHLVIEPKRQSHEPVGGAQLREAFVGASLVVLFAEATHIERVREEGSGMIPLSPPFHVGEEDSYLLLPDDIGEEIIDILRDGDEELLRDAMRDGLLVQGSVEKSPRGRGMVLDAELTCSPNDVLEAGAAYASSVSLSRAGDALRAINTLSHVQCTTLSALVDEDGLGAMLRAHEHIGASWRPPSSAKALSNIAPTYAWSKKLLDGRVGVQLALFQEDDELVVVLMPVVIEG